MILVLTIWTAGPAARADDAALQTVPPASPDIPDIEDLITRTILIPEVSAVVKFKQKATEAPSAVTVVTADEIKFYGHRTLADVLRTVPGMHTSYDRNYTFLGVRGFNRGDINSLNSRMLLLVDGHRVNNNLTDGAFIGNEFLLDVDLIDKVEVSRGPGSVLYGNNAFFGIINVVTKKGAQLKGIEASGEAGSFDTFKGRLSYGNQFKNGLEMLLSGTLYDSAGSDDGFPSGLDQESYGNVFGTISYHDFTLQGGYNDRKKNNPTAQFLTEPGDDHLRTQDRRGYASLSYNRSFADVVDVIAQVYYDSYDFNIGYPYSGDPDLNKEFRSGQWWGAEVQFTKRLMDRHTLTLGGEYRQDFQQELTFYTNTAYAPSLEVQGTTENYGVYLQGDFLVVSNVHLNAGVRYDQYGDYDSTFNPRLALIYSPWRKTVLKGIYGTAFRAPDFMEPILAFPATGLEPETITTYEVILGQGIGRHLWASVSGFYNQIDGLISFESGRFANQDAIAQGLEFGLEGYWTNGLRARLSYTLQEAEDRATGRRLTDSPMHLAKANLVVPLYRDKLFAGVELQYTSSRYTTRLIPPGPNTTPGPAADDFAIVNLTLFSQRLVKGLELSATVYNVFDERYSDPATSQHWQATIPQDGRTFRVKLTYRY